MRARSCRLVRAEASTALAALAFSSGVSVEAIRPSRRMERVSRCAALSRSCASRAAVAALRPAKPCAASCWASWRMPMGEISSALLRLSQRWRSKRVGAQISGIADHGSTKAPRPPDGLATTISREWPISVARMRAFSRMGVVKGTVAPLSLKLSGSGESNRNRSKSICAPDMMVPSPEASSSRRSFCAHPTKCFFHAISPTKNRRKRSPVG